jgi:hypothetical protein
MADGSPMLCLRASWSAPTMSGKSRPKLLAWQLLGFTIIPWHGDRRQDLHQIHTAAGPPYDHVPAATPLTPDAIAVHVP